jgi:hypothetical protein
LITLYHTLYEKTVFKNLNTISFLYKWKWQQRKKHQSLQRKSKQGLNPRSDHLNDLSCGVSLSFVNYVLYSKIFLFLKWAKIYLLLAFVVFIVALLFVVRQLYNRKFKKVWIIINYKTKERIIIGTFTYFSYELQR